MLYTMHIIEKLLLSLLDWLYCIVSARNIELGLPQVGCFITSPQFHKTVFSVFLITVFSSEESKIESSEGNLDFFPFITFS